jgi:hypothetical protein
MTHEEDTDKSHSRLSRDSRVGGRGKEIHAVLGMEVY